MPPDGTAGAAMEWRCLWLAGIGDGRMIGMDATGRTADRDARVDQAFAALSALLPGRASRGDSQRDLHAGDMSPHAPCRPDIVATPETTGEVAAIVRIAAEAGLPIVPFGAGSGLEGGAIAAFGGVSIDTSGLGRILEIRPDDMIVRVEAGVRRLALNAALRDTACSFPSIPARMPRWAAWPPRAQAARMP